MTRFIHQTMSNEDGFAADIFNITTIALASVLGLLTIAATI